MTRNSSKFNALTEQYLFGQNWLMSLSFSRCCLCLFLALMLLSGCGGGGDTQDVDDTTKPKPKPDTGSSIPTLGQPKKISLDGDGDVLSPHLLVDGRSDSTVTAVWRQYDGIRHNLFSSKYAENNGFWTPQPVSLEASDGDVRDVEMVVDNNGSVTVAWTQDMGTHYGLWANFYDWNTSRWRDPVLIEGSNTGDVDSMVLQVDASRRVTAVWTQFDAAGNEQLWINHFHPNEGASGTWRGAKQVSDGAKGRVSAMKVVSDRFGAMMLVWAQLNAAGTYVDLWAQRYVPPSGGAAWSSTSLQRLDHEDKGNVVTPAVVVDFSGSYTVVWGQYDGTRQDLWTTRYSGSVWESATKVETQDLGSIDAPWLFMDSADVMTAVWLQHNGVVNQVWTKQYASGAWGAARMLSNGTGHVSALTTMANADGEIVLAWLQDSGGRDDLWTAYFDANNWGTAQIIETSNSSPATLPLLFLDNSGNVTAIWHQMGTAYADLWANRYNVGSGWATATKLANWDDGNVMAAPKGIIDAMGKVTIVWPQHHESEDHLLVSQYNLASGDWSEPNKVGENNAVGGHAPRLAIDNAGKITLIWLQPTTERVELWGNRL